MKNDDADTGILFDFGTFGGRHWPTECVQLDGSLPARDVVEWDEIDRGEAEFWPTGDKPELVLVFSEESPARAKDLVALSGLLKGLGGDSLENYLLIRHAMDVAGLGIRRLTPELLKAFFVHIVVGHDMGEVHVRAGEALQAHFCSTSGEREDAAALPARVRGSSGWTIKEYGIGDRVAVLIAPKPMAGRR